MKIIRLNSHLKNPLLKSNLTLLKLFFYFVLRLGFFFPFLFLRVVAFRKTFPLFFDGFCFLLFSSRGLVCFGIYDRFRPGRDRWGLRDDFGVGAFDGDNSVFLLHPGVVMDAWMQGRAHMPHSVTH